jgi:hypothetical protein
VGGVNDPGACLVTGDGFCGDRNLAHQRCMQIASLTVTG